MPLPSGPGADDRTGRTDGGGGSDGASILGSDGASILDSGRRVVAGLLRELAVPADHPRQLRDYDLLAVLGAGAMGTVYRAWQISLQREVAVKLLAPGVGHDAEDVERFLREARAAGRVQHASIVQVLDAGIESGRPYIAMQLVRGASLQQVLQHGGRLEVERALQVIRDAGRALQAAHDAGIVHRDIKPGNILVEGDVPAARSSGLAYVSDFGLASLAGEGSLTDTGKVLGTPSYMSPEQARGLAAGRASDVYSLGATLYALLSGRAPHEGTNPAELVARVGREDPVALRRLDPSIDSEAALICEKAMRWDPARRYASAAELADDVERRLARLPIRARPASRAYRLSLWAKRNPRALKAAALGLLVALLGFLGERGLRRERLIEAAHQLLARGDLDQAESKLEEVPWVPWPHGEDREVEAWLQVQLAKLDLRAAVDTAMGLSLPLRRKTNAMLRLAIDQEIRDAELLLAAPMRNSALRDLWDAAGGLESLMSPGEAEACPREWAKAAADRVAKLAVKGLLDAEEDIPAARIFGECLAAEFGPLREVTVTRAVLEGFLGTGGKAKRPRHLEADALLAQLLEDLLAPGRGRAGNREPFAEVYEVLDHYLPLLPQREAARVKRHVEVLLSLRPTGGPLPIQRPGAGAVGDLDGDGDPEVATSIQQDRIQVLEWRPEGIAVSHELRVEEEESSVANLQIEALLLADLDDARGEELIVFHQVVPVEDPSASWSRIRAYSLRSGELHVHGVPVGPIHGTTASTAPAMAVADLNGDGKPELVVGTAAGGPDQRQVWIVEAPFTPGVRRRRLPDGRKESDVRGVFTGDFDGDGTLEVGCIAGPWKGYDVRFWKSRGPDGSYEGPLRFGPLGTFYTALPIDLDGQKPSELFLASSSHSYNEDLFSAPAHTGLRPGAYVFRVPPGETITEHAAPVTPGRPEGTFLWYDAFGEVLRDPVESLEPRALSSKRWTDRRQAVAVSWAQRRGRRVTAFVDLYLQRHDPVAFTRHRVFWQQGREEAGLLAFLLERPAAGGLLEPGIVVLRGEAVDSWSAQAWSVHPPDLPVEPEDLRLVEALTRAELYETAARQAREWGSRAAAGRAAAELTLAEARAAGRGLDWEALRGVLRRLRPLSGHLGHLGDELLVREQTALERLAARGGLLAAQASVAALDGPLTVDLEKPRQPASGRVPLLRLAEGIRVAAPCDLELAFDVDVEAIGFNRNVLVGLSPHAVDPREPFWGVELWRGGGGGQTLRDAVLWWKGTQRHFTDPERLLQDGKSYRVRLERTASGRVHLQIREISGGGSAPFQVTHPPYDPRKPLTEDEISPRPEASPLLPVPGGYDLWLVDMNPDAGERTKLTFRNVALRLLPVERRQE